MIFDAFPASCYRRRWFLLRFPTETDMTSSPESDPLKDLQFLLSRQNWPRYLSSNYPLIFHKIVFWVDCNCFYCLGPGSCTNIQSTNFNSFQTQKLLNISVCKNTCIECFFASILCAWKPSWSQCGPNCKIWPFFQVGPTLKNISHSTHQVGCPNPMTLMTVCEKFGQEFILNGHGASDWSILNFGPHKLHFGLEAIGHHDLDVAITYVCVARGKWIRIVPLWGTAPYLYWWRCPYLYFFPPVCESIKSYRGIMLCHCARISTLLNNLAM